MPNRLILIPTEMERRLIEPALGQAWADKGNPIELCGFGPIEAAAATARLIAERSPNEVVLLGIAGTYVAHLAVGSAYEFAQVSCYGIGVGNAGSYKTPEELGWSQRGALQLAARPAAPQLLTCCTASENSDDVTDRLAKFPKAVAEDMEAYAVAVACHDANIPLCVIRGVSNNAGDRDKSNWQIESAARAAAELYVREKAH